MSWYQNRYFDWSYSENLLNWRYTTSTGHYIEGHIQRRTLYRWYTTSIVRYIEMIRYVTTLYCYLFCKFIISIFLNLPSATQGSVRTWVSSSVCRCCLRRTWWTPASWASMGSRYQPSNLLWDLWLEDSWKKHKIAMTKQNSNLVYQNKLMYNKRIALRCRILFRLP